MMESIFVLSAFTNPSTLIACLLRFNPQNRQVTDSRKRYVLAWLVSHYMATDDYHSPTDRTNPSHQHLSFAGTPRCRPSFSRTDANRATLNGEFAVEEKENSKASVQCQNVFPITRHSVSHGSVIHEAFSAQIQNIRASLGPPTPKRAPAYSRCTYTPTWQSFLHRCIMQHYGLHRCCKPPSYSSRTTRSIDSVDKTSRSPSVHLP